jgi:hypothetical protein
LRNADTVLADRTLTLAMYPLFQSHIQAHILTWFWAIVNERLWTVFPPIFR